METGWISELTKKTGVGAAWRRVENDEFLRNYFHSNCFLFLFFVCRVLVFVCALPFSCFASIDCVFSIVASTASIDRFHSVLSFLRLGLIDVFLILPMYNTSRGFRGSLGN